MTRVETTDPTEERWLSTEWGVKEAEDAFRAPTFDGFIDSLGIDGLNYIIARVVDEHYPADVFPTDGVIYPSWGGEHGGSDIQPGVKWIALLRQALEEIIDAERE